MPLADYEGWMATAYDGGRALSPQAETAWAAAATPWLRSGAGPVLDLGAGTGRFAGLLVAWSGGPVVAVEPTAAMAERAAAKGLPGVTVVRGAAEAVPLVDRSVRAVWMSQVVHHVDDRHRAAVELARILRPGGHVLLRGEYADEPREPRPANALYRYFPAAAALTSLLPTRREVTDTLAAAGLAPVHHEVVDQVTCAGLRDLHARMATRADSLLARIDDTEFDAGLAALARDAAAETSPRPVVDRLSLLVFRAPHTASGTLAPTSRERRG
jgi:ubiquinone/menaquinone biosynthesis C-methylase UbiE